MMHRLLLHRERDLEFLTAQVSALGRNCPGLTIIDGAPGMGKTLLLDAVAESASAALVLRARGHHAEQDFPYGVIHQLFDPVLASSRPGGDGGLGEQLDDLRPGSVHHVLRGMFDVVRALAVTRALLVVIDDFHAADPESVRCLAYIARRMDGLPVGVIVTCDRTCPNSVAELDSLPFSRHVSLAPLCPACGETLVATAFGTPVDAEFAGACHALARGNPLVLHRLCEGLLREGVTPDRTALNAIAAIGSQVLWDLSRHRLRTRSPRSVELLECLAVLGPHTDAETAGLLLGLDEDTTRELCRALSEMGLITSGPRARLTLTQLSPAIASEVDAVRRGELHERAAVLLHRIGARPQQVAEHLISAGPGDRREFGAVLRLAARDAGAEQDWDAAERYLRRAAAADQDPLSPALSELGAVQIHLDVPASLQSLQLVRERVADPVDRAAALAPFAQLPILLESAAAGHTFSSVWSALPVGATTSIGPAAMVQIAGHAALSGGRIDVRPLFQAMRMLARSGSDAEAMAQTNDLRCVQAITAAARGSGRAAVVRHCLAVRDSAVGGTDPTLVWGAVLALACAGALGWADQWAQRLLHQARQRRSRTELAVALIAKSELDYRLGALESSHAAACEAVDRAGEVNAAGPRDLALGMAMRARLERGANDPGDPRFTLATARSAAHPLARAIQLEVHGRFHIVQGNVPEGLRDLLDAGRQLTSHGITNPAWVPWQSRAVLALLSIGERAVAREIADQQLASARAWGAPATIGRALTTAAGTRPQPERLPMLRKAVEALEADQAVLDRARALVALGTALTAAGSEAEARVVLRKAIVLSDQCGANRLRARAQSQLAAAGGRSGGRPGLASVPLTAAELRVALLVVKEMTNQQVASALHLSTRTVDTHLANIYRKLGIRKRAQLHGSLKLVGHDI